MKLVITNIHDRAISLEIPKADGEVLRALIGPHQKYTFNDIDPYDVNTYKIVRDLVFRSGAVTVDFIREPDDLVSLASDKDYSGFAEAQLTGSDRVWTTPHQFVANTLTCYHNGVKLQQDSDYTVTLLHGIGVGIHLVSFTPKATSRLTATYIKSI